MDTTESPMRIYERSTDLSTYRGRSGTIAVNALTIGVEIKDARLRFGHLDLLVSPLHGSGEQWIESHRVVVDD